jgi:hypothetical protein
MHAKVFERRLCEVSDFFKKACDDRWESGHRGILRFPDDEPGSWSLFLSWLNTGDIKAAPGFIVCDASDLFGRTKEFFSQYVQLVESYILGERLQVYEFKNKIMDLLLENMKLTTREVMAINCSSESVLQMIYDRTAVGSPLRRYVIDGSYYLNGRNAVEQCIGKLESNLGFTSEIQTFLLNTGESEKLLPPYRRDPCNYHDHGDKEDGFKCAPRPWG